MKAKSSCRLVIDASIARSAGTTDHPVSSSCRRFLETVLDVCHRAVFTPELTQEWKDHQTRWTSRWRSAMVGRKKVIWIQTIENAAVRAAIDAVSISERRRKEIRKDAHLVEAALQADQTVVSRDENTARQPFSEIAVKVPSIRHLIRVNPTCPEENPIEWLQNGAPPDPYRRLRR